jgi:putative transcriptional regulator
MFCLLCSIAFPLASQPRISVGTLLISSPGLLDPNFRETVVLIVDYGPGGTGGLIINRPSGMALSEIFPSREGLSSRQDVLWQGGPVLPRGLMALVQDPADAESDSVEILEGIRLIDPARALEQLDRAETGSDPVRILAGHAGWSSGQLEAEILRGGWKLLPARREWVFSEDPEGLWKTLIELVELPTT